MAWSRLKMNHFSLGTPLTGFLENHSCERSLALLPIQRILFSSTTSYFCFPIGYDWKLGKYDDKYIIQHEQITCSKWTQSQVWTGGAIFILFFCFFVFHESLPWRFTGHLVETRSVQQGTLGCSKIFSQQELLIFMLVSGMKVAGQRKATFIKMNINHCEIHLQGSFIHP